MLKTLASTFAPRAMCCLWSPDCLQLLSRHSASYRIYRTCGAPRVASAAPHVRPLPVDSSGYLAGAVVAMACTLVSVLPMDNGMIPINAITPIAGVPVILYVIINAVRYSISTDRDETLARN